MKYWNKTKKYRDLHWVTVNIEYNSIVNSSREFKSWGEIKLWCQRHPSVYRFYSGTYNRRVWYFENSEDALMFKLRWGTRATHNAPPLSKATHG